MSKVKQYIHKNFSIYLGVVFLLALIVVLKILYLMIFRKNYYKNYSISITTTFVEPRRGNILSRNNRLLATSVVSYDIYIDAYTDYIQKYDTVFTNNVDQLAEKLSQLFKDKSKEEYKRFLLEAHNKRRRYVLLKRNVSYDQYQQLKTFPIFNLGRARGGLIAIEKYQRVKPHGFYAKRTIGEYYPNGNRENIGLEAQYNAQLSGKNGIRVLRRISRIGYVELKDEVPPVPGADLVTSLDMNLQYYVENALLERLKQLKASWGTAVVMEVKTGEILAMANLMLDTVDSNYYESINLAISKLYDPGSVMKPISMLALFEEYPDVSLNEKIDRGSGKIKRGDYTLNDYFKVTPQNRYLTLQEVIELSSNVGVVRFIEKYFKGKEHRFIDRLISFGVDRKTGIDLPGERSMALKTPNNSDWWQFSLGLIAIGYEHFMTPIQILAIYNAIANDGYYVQPHLGKKIIYPDGNEQVLETKYKTRIASMKALNKVKKMLVGVVENGTAKDYVKSDLVKIAGKTGTAEVLRYDPKLKKWRYLKQENNATFVGYFPAQNPIYSMIVVIGNPKGVTGGGAAAGPVFKKIAEQLYFTDYRLHSKYEYDISFQRVVNDLPKVKYGQKQPIIDIATELKLPIVDNTKYKNSWAKTYTTDSAIVIEDYTIRKNQMPNVIGLNAKDAVYLLENLGLNVNIIGRGTVIRQSIPSGSKIKHGKKVTIYLR